MLKTQTMICILFVQSLKSAIDFADNNDEQEKSQNCEWHYQTTQNCDLYDMRLENCEPAGATFALLMELKILLKY